MKSVLLVSDTPEFRSDICDCIRIFYPGAVILLEGEAEYRLIHENIYKDGVWYNRYALFNIAGEIEDSIEASNKAVSSSNLLHKRYQKRYLKLALYRLLKKRTGITPPWGALTGIRPTRLAYELAENGEDPYRTLIDVFDVSPGKASLVMKTIEVQKGLIDRNVTDVYIGIPFCATRCSYCSFAAVEYNRNRMLAEPYIKALCSEIDAIGDFINERGIKIGALYIGGGTPTALETDYFREMLEKCALTFKAAEFTVEAGRPDTIDGEKLHLMAGAGVGRISINPQTMNDRTLEGIGRRHTAKDIEMVYEKARNMFPVINMDVIAGLPGEDASDFSLTLDRIGVMKPENLTVHTLAYKKGSVLRLSQAVQPDERSVEKMLALASEFTEDNGYRPYYMYRQKYMTGNMENVGYSLAGCECRYNIDNMEETASVLALGAGAISKRVYPSGGRIERAANVKDIRTYIERTEDMIARKLALFSDL